MRKGREKENKRIQGEATIDFVIVSVVSHQVKFIFNPPVLHRGTSVVHGSYVGA